MKVDKMEGKLYRIDNVYWMVDKVNRVATPICPKDHMELTYVSEDFFTTDEMVSELECEECHHTYRFSRSVYDEKYYAIEKVLALDRKKYEIVDIDGVQTPVTKKVKPAPNAEYFCTAQIRDSRRGPQLVIYAGKKGSDSNKKSQIFVSEEERRLSFDQTDINPADLFARVVAEFPDGTKHTIEKGANDGSSK